MRRPCPAAWMVDLGEVGADDAGPGRYDFTELVTSRRNIAHVNNMRALIGEAEPDARSDGGRHWTVRLADALQCRDPSLPDRSCWMQDGRRFAAIFRHFGVDTPALAGARRAWTR